MNFGIRPSANSVFVKRVVRLETSVCFRITRLMNNQIKSRKKSYFPKEEKAMTRMLWLLGKVNHNWVVYHKIQMHSFLKVESLGETRCRKFWNQFRGYDSLSLRYVEASIREKKGPSLGKINVNVLHQRSPCAVKFEDRSHEQTERQQRCARSKAWNLAKNIFKLKEEDKAAFYFPAEELVLPAASTKEPEESLWWIQERVCIWSASETITLLSWR